MILKDFYCVKCGRERLDVEVQTCDVITTRMVCSECGTLRNYRVICNGGARDRWRYLDLYPRDYRPPIKAEAPQVLEPDGSPSLDQDGTPTHSKYKYANEEKRDIRRDKVQAATRRKQGTTPITLDLGGK
jgi:hypothetical protein